jgi:hypothetical protein
MKNERRRNPTSQNAVISTWVLFLAIFGLPIINNIYCLVDEIHSRKLSIQKAGKLSLPAYLYKEAKL